MRREDPVYWHPTLQMWFLTRFDDIAAMASDPRCTATRDRRDDAQVPATLRTQVVMIEEFLARWLSLNDPPAHTQLRRAATALFTPQALSHLRALVEQTVTQCLDRVHSKDAFDVMSVLAFPLARTVLCHLLQIPVADLPLLKAWLKDAMALVSARQATAQAVALSAQGIEGLQAYFCRVADQHASDSVGQWSVLVGGDSRQTGLDMQEKMSLAAVLPTGGYETVAYQLGNAVLALLEHPEEARKLRQQPEFIKLASEECVRYEGAVGSLMHRVRQDMDFHGVLIPANAIVLGLLHAGNRDPGHFAEPDRLLVDRQPNRHLGFGSGVHTCLGAMLARIQIHVAVSALLERFPRWQLAYTQLERVPSFIFRGLRSLPMRIR
jgi:cytochrome P450